MNIDITNYKTIVFDCDGVILNSNKIKIDVFYDVAINFGASASQAQALVDYHVKFGGVSRYRKFDYFLREILIQEVKAESMDLLLSSFTSKAKVALQNCEVSPFLFELRMKTPSSSWMVVSGSDQEELREILKLRGVDDLFNAGIFGSPDNKDQILERELNFKNIQPPALFIGDSRYDHVASTKAGLTFSFVYGWTDFKEWHTYCDEHEIKAFENLGDFL